ncbi:MAG: MATE family efflux transporter [Prevotella sp.]|nr:MATE family efflux transporter [Prevotella sp.]
MVNRHCGIDREILRLALPSIVSNITVPLLGLCDVTIMGHVGGATSIGAIAVGSMIFNVMYWLFAFLRMGSSGLTAQAYGARRQRDVVATLWRGLLVGVSCGLAIVVLQVPLQWLTFWLMRPTFDVAQLCQPYYYICVWGAPAVLGLFALTGWLVGMQNTRVPMAIAIGQNVVNIAVSVVLVLVFHQGVRGVAIGTLVAQWTAFLVGLLLVARGYGRLLRRLWPSLAQLGSGLGRFFRLNLDIFLRTVCLVSVNLYFTSAGAAQGSLVLAANTLLMQFFMMYSYMTDGFAFAGEALSGRFLGAGDQNGLRQVVHRLFWWGGAVALLFTVVYLLCGMPLLRLLTSDAAVVAAAREYLPWAVLIPAAGMAAFVWDGIFIGTTRSRGMLVSCFWAAVTFFVVWFVLSPLWGNNALWLALLVYLAMRGLVQTFLWNKSV